MLRIQDPAITPTVRKMVETKVEVAQPRVAVMVPLSVPSSRPADRVAIDEELVRLDSHFGAMNDIISKPEPAGRKLDFLLQEINRETNTIGSKCKDLKITEIVLQMKAEVEKIREQVQNIE